MRIHKTLAALALSAALLSGGTSAHAALPTYQNPGSIRGREGRVVALNHETNIITIDDGVFLWQWFTAEGGDCDGWEVGDDCVFVICDVNGTADITDDVILSVTYARFDLLPNV